MKKISKEELTDVLKRLLKYDTYEEVVEEIGNVADEFNLDLTEADEDEDEEAVVIEEDIELDADLEGDYYMDDEGPWDSQL